MVLTVVAWKFPFESGPKSTASPALMDPELMIPSTTVPTYGTEYTSVIEYSNGWSAVNFSVSLSLAGSRLRKVRN